MQRQPSDLGSSPTLRPAHAPLRSRAPPHPVSLLHLDPEPPEPCSSLQPRPVTSSPGPRRPRCLYCPNTPETARPSAGVGQDPGPTFNIPPPSGIRRSSGRDVHRNYVIINWIRRGFCYGVWKAKAANHPACESRRCPSLLLLGHGRLCRSGGLSFARGPVTSHEYYPVSLLLDMPRELRASKC